MNPATFHNQFITVETKAPAILGTLIQGRLEGTYMSFGIAMSFKDIAPLHAQVLPYLPEGQRVELTDDTFVLLRLNDTVTPFAMSWLKLDTMAIVEETKITVVVSGDMDQSRLRQLLLANGYTVLTMGVGAVPSNPLT